MNARRRMISAFGFGLLSAPLGLLAQDPPPDRPMRSRMRQNMRDNMAMHEKMASAVSKVRESLAMLQAETDVAKIKAALAEDEKLLAEVEGQMAARATRMRLMMPQDESDNAPSSGDLPDR